MTPYDVAAILLNGFSHLYVFRLLIQYDRLSFTMMAGISFLFCVLLAITVAVTGYPEWNGILLLLFLIGIGLVKGNVPYLHNVYFALLSTVGVTLAKLVGTEIAFQMYMMSPLNLYIWTPSVLHLIVTLFILSAILTGRRQLVLYGQYAVTGPIYVISYLLLGAGLFVVMLLTTPSSLVQASWYEQAAYASYISAFVLFLLLVLILLVSRQVYKDQRDAQQQQLLDAELLTYIEELEKIHDEFISFRHDYLNVLQTLDEGVRDQNMELIKKVYTDVVAPTSEQLKLREYDLLKLSRILIPEVKSVLGVKMMTAYQHNLDVTIDIPETVQTIKMSIFEFVRIITILLDNAIEEAVVSEDRFIHLALFDTPDIQYLIVRNSSRIIGADLPKLFAKHVTRKERGRGVGLHSLKRIVEKTPHATLETSVSKHLFSQQLLLKKELGHL